MKRRIGTILTALVLCLSLCPAGALAAEGGGTGTGTALDLSGAGSSKGNLDTDGYRWEVVIDGSTTNRTLTLAAGFNKDKVILPDAAVIIVMQEGADLTIDELTAVPSTGFGGSPSNTQLTFTGKGTLTINERINLGGGNKNRLTVDVNATVVAKKGIDIGDSGVDGLITVNGTLIAVHGEESDAGSSAIYAGKVVIGSTDGTAGVLKVSGRRGVQLCGMSSGFSDLFSVNENSRFTANCTEVNLVVTPNSGSFPEGTNPATVIQLGAAYLPSDCVIGRNSTGNGIGLLRKNTTDPYTGDLTIHLNHDWDMENWTSDEDNHWHRCKFDGCDKRLDEDAHSATGSNGATCQKRAVCDVCKAQYGASGQHTPSGWIIDKQATADAAGEKHKECTVCKKVLESATIPQGHTHSYGTKWEMDDTNHWHECSCGEKSDVAPHTPGSWITDTPATAGTAGSRHRVCTVCNRTLNTETIPATGGTPSTPSTPNTPSTSGDSGGAATYLITVDWTGRGTVTARPGRAEAGRTVTLTVTPADGYSLDALTVTDSRGNPVSLTDQDGGKAAFSMPNRAVTVRAVFTRPQAAQTCDGGAGCPSRGFTDLGGAEAWYHEAVDYVLENGLMNGFGNGTFGPDSTLTRAQLVQILYNNAGRPVVNYLMRFGDVRQDAWCAEAVRWAAAEGIAGGYEDGRFGVNEPVTREQLAVMLWRYAGSPAAGQTALAFTDADQAGAYASDALRWAVERGVMGGYGDGRLNPKGAATRAQAAQMLRSFLENG